MNLSEADQIFLRDLVKVSRQKPNFVEWTDRDGSKRLTVLTQPEVVRLATLASRLKVSKGELMRQAGHIPVAKPPPKAAADAAEGEMRSTLGA